MPFLENEGKFKAKAIGRAIVIASTGATGAEITFFILAYYNPEKKDWFDCTAKNMTLKHTFYIYRGDNSPIEFSQKALKTALAWSGDILAFDEHSGWVMPECVIETAFEEYRGKTNLRVKWLNPLGGNSGHAQRASSRSQLEEIKQRLAGQAPTAQDEPGSNDIPF